MEQAVACGHPNRYELPGIYLPIRRLKNRPAAEQYYPGRLAASIFN